MSQGVARLAAATNAFGAALLVSLAVVTVLVAKSAPAETRPPVLDIQRMTFVASRGSVSEVILRAETARVDTDLNVVHLENVSVKVSSGKSKSHLEMTCLKGDLDLKTSDFKAEGDVTGHTDSGLEFSAAWIRYNHEQGLLFTDAPVVITDGAGTFRGGGFRYLIDERRFKLLGGASVVQQN